MRRVNFDTTDTFHIYVHALAKKHGITVAELFRKGAEIYGTLSELKDDGVNDLHGKKENGEIVVYTIPII